MDRILPNYLPTGEWTRTQSATPTWWPVPGRVLTAARLADCAADGVATRRYALVVLRDGKPIAGTTPIPLDDGRSAYTIGKTSCTIPAEHPSCSNVHAVLCFKLPMPNALRRSTHADEAEDETEDPHWARSLVGRVCSAPELYLVDVGSSNGTKLNGKLMDPWLYYPLLAGDTVRFGMSTREFVVVER